MHTCSRGGPTPRCRSSASSSTWRCSWRRRRARSPGTGSCWGSTPRSAPSGRPASQRGRRNRRSPPPWPRSSGADVPAGDDPAGNLAVTGSVVVPAAALRWRFSRSSGPGGQGVNTADSRVELSVAPLELPDLDDARRRRLAARLAGRLVDGVLTITASEHRQQLRNRQAARERLAAVLRAALAPPPPSRRRTKPTRGSQERRIEAKKQRGQLKKQRRSWD